MHLRGGLRSGTECGNLRQFDRRSHKRGRILQPRQDGVGDRAALWLSNTNPRRYPTLKELIARAFRLTDQLWGTIPGLNLEVVIQKQR